MCLTSGTYIPMNIVQLKILFRTCFVGKFFTDKGAPEGQEWPSLILSAVF